MVPNREDGTLQVFYAASLLPAATIPVGAGPEQVAILPDSSVAFVSAAASNQISVVDLRRFALLANLPVEGPPVDLILKPDGGELYVTSPASNGMEVINTWTHEVAQTLVLGAAPTRGILTSDAGVLYISDAAAGRIMPVDIGARRLRRPIPADQQPGQSRFDPEENLLLVVNEGSDDLAVIRVRTGSLITLIPVGHRPRDIAVKLF